MGWTLRDRARAARDDPGLAIRTTAWPTCSIAGGSASCDGDPAVVSNHPRETYAHLDLGGMPFHHLPVTNDTKLEQEAASGS